MADDTDDTVPEGIDGRGLELQERKVVRNLLGDAQDGGVAGRHGSGCEGLDHHCHWPCNETVTVGCGGV